MNDFELTIPDLYFNETLRILQNIEKTIVLSKYTTWPIYEHLMLSIFKINCEGIEWENSKNYVSWNLNQVYLFRCNLPRWSLFYCSPLKVLVLSTSSYIPNKSKESLHFRFFLWGKRHPWSADVSFIFEPEVYSMKVATAVVDKNLTWLLFRFYLHSHEMWKCLRFKNIRLVETTNTLNIQECKNYTCWLIFVYHPQILP